MTRLSIDIETYSSIDIGSAGLYKYAQSPDFEVLLFAYSIDASPVQIIDLAQGEVVPPDIKAMLVDQEVTKHAYNAAFEWYCLSRHFGETLPLNQWRCTMLHGLYMGYPAGLAAIGNALNLTQDQKKDRAGAALIKLFSCPTKPSRANDGRTRTLPHHEPEKWQLFKEYCAQDVVTEMAVEDRLSVFPVPVDIQRQWEIDQIQNAGGVAIDRKLVSGAVAIMERNAAELTAEAKSITGLSNPNSVAQLRPWFEEKTGQNVPDMTKETVSELLSDVADPQVERALEIRQELARSSIKKYTAMGKAVCADGRIRGLTQFYGASRTGRWAGRIVQVQNLTKNQTDMLDLARELVKKQNIDAIRVIFGQNISNLLAELVRTSFVAPKGCKIISADYSAIEARVLAWLALEEWRLQAFREGKDIYCASASQMFGVPVEKHGENGHLRQKGKIAELALGYQGGVGALKQMGALNMGLTEEELPGIVQAWRSSNRMIVNFWYEIEKATIKTIRTGEPHLLNGIRFSRYCCAKEDDYLIITLPSKRKLFYARPFLAPNEWGQESIHYYGMNQTTKKWEDQQTYGGKLTENIVQATARDCLAESITRLYGAGYKVVFTVHDEVVIEAPDDASVDAICDLMAQPLPWAKNLYLPVEGFQSPYYKKE